MTAKHPSLRVNLLELQGQVLWLVGDHNEGHDKFLTTAQSPADEPALGAPIPQELGSADKQGGLPWSTEAWAATPACHSFRAAKNREINIIII
ncbi:golgin subfamily A member 6C-like isoform X2 [Piliocolobus tephrosceles]|uniref:golgin subfamily A member 6C-like isoform X2 n=1 Tax=Piliocolobus tephrosceles TaxID=591936 RepID=UPI0013019600|nr:golgin subfamily A member 6C-like isoform X2 [Piliocolobus tephrosceles]